MVNSCPRIATEATSDFSSLYGEYSYIFIDYSEITSPGNFIEEKPCNDGERVLCKSTSTRRELKKLPNRTGYKARKEFWR